MRSDVTVDYLHSYPGLQSNVPGFRVPSIVCYEPDGTVRACGAEAEALERDFDTDFVDLGDGGSDCGALVFVRRCVRTST